MIHVIVGGALSGKTTYVRAKYLSGQIEVRKDGRVPVTTCQGISVIGNYRSVIRCCGVDQMGRDRKLVQSRVLDWLDLHASRDQLVVLEGTSLHDDAFFKKLKAYRDVKLIYLFCPGEVIAQRAKTLNITWIDIVRMTHKKAAVVFQKWRKEFDHEIVDQHRVVQAGRKG